MKNKYTFRKFLVLLLAIIFAFIGFVSMFAFTVISHSLFALVSMFVFFSLSIDCLKAIEETEEQCYE